MPEPSHSLSQSSGILRVHTIIISISQIRLKEEKLKCPNQLLVSLKRSEPGRYLLKPYHQLPQPNRLPSHLPQLAHQRSGRLEESPTTANAWFL